MKRRRKKKKLFLSKKQILFGSIIFASITAIVAVYFINSYAAVDPTKVSRIYDTPQKEIAFTFDDGPNGSGKPTVNILKNYGAKATFFEIGNAFLNNSAGTSEVKYIKAAGMEIGAHAWSHDSQNTQIGTALMESNDSSVCTEQFNNCLLYTSDAADE